MFGAPFASRCLEISRARACVYFARPTIAIAKIRDYLQSIILTIIYINRHVFSVRDDGFTCQYY